MDEDGIGAPLDGRLEKRERRRDAASRFCGRAGCLRPAGHWGNSRLNRSISKQIVQIQFEFDPIHEILYPIKCVDASG